MGANMFARLGAFAYRRRGRVVIAWIIGLLILGAISGAAGSAFSTKFGLPGGVESKRGLDILDEHFGGVGAGQSGSIVIHTADGSVTDPATQTAVQAYLDQVATIPGVAQVSSPYAEGGARQIAAQGDEAGKIAYASIQFPADATQDDLKDTAAKIEDAAPTVAGVDFEYG